MIYAINKLTKEHREYVADGVLPLPRSQWGLAEADDEGWIPLYKGFNPLPKDHPFEVKYATGRTVELKHPQNHHWDYKVNKEDYKASWVAYRPIFEDEVSEVQPKFKTKPHLRMVNGKYRVWRHRSACPWQLPTVIGNETVLGSLIKYEAYVS